MRKQGQPEPGRRPDRAAPAGRKRAPAKTRTDWVAFFMLAAHASTPKAVRAHDMTHLPSDWVARRPRGAPRRRGHYPIIGVFSQISPVRVTPTQQNAQWQPVLGKHARAAVRARRRSRRARGSGASEAQGQARTGRGSSAALGQARAGRASIVTGPARTARIARRRPRAPKRGRRCPYPRRKIRLKSPTHPARSTPKNVSERTIFSAPMCARMARRVAWFLRVEKAK